MLPATTSNSPERSLIRATISIDRRASGRARCRRRARRRRRRRAPGRARSRPGPTPTAAPTRSRPCGSFVDCGNSIRFWMSLTVIRPLEDPVGVDDRQLLDPVAVEELLGLARASSRPARSRGPSEVIRADTGWRRVLLEAQVAVGEDPDEPPALVGDRNAGDVVAAPSASSASATSAVGGSVSGSTIIPDSERLTLSTSADLVWRSRGCGARSRSRPRARARSPSGPR